MPTLRAALLSLSALLSCFALGALVASALGGEPAPTAHRKALAQANRVQGAPGRTLVLSNVVIDPGASLPLHRHRGTQVARIHSGALTYTVERGAVVVRRGESDHSPVVVRTIETGQTGTLRAGDWIVEQPTVIHRAANRGSTPVVISLATLLEKGVPPSTPVALPASD